MPRRPLGAATGAVATLGFWPRIPHRAEPALGPFDALPPLEQWPRLPGLLTVVVPVFREEAGIVYFTESLLSVLETLGIPVEIILVEDDSPDASLKKIRELHGRYPAVIRALSLSRRFGHQASLAAGLEAARGDVVITMDSDMQHPPALVPYLLWQWSRGFQLVYTRRRRQEGRGWLKEQASYWFYKLINRITDIRFEEGAADFRLMDRVVVDALRRVGECGLMYRGLVQWAGFRRTAVDFIAPARFAGSSSYTWTRMLRLALDAVFNFSLKPLRLSYVVGGVSLLATLGYAFWAMLSWLRGGVEVPGYVSLVLLVSFLGSLHLICLGIVGEYVGRVHEQVKGRPRYLVKETIGLHSPAKQEAA